jgi:hypothetical protein
MQMQPCSTQCLSKGYTMESYAVYSVKRRPSCFAPTTIPMIYFLLDLVANLCHMSLLDVGTPSCSAPSTFATVPKHACHTSFAKGYETRI